MSDLFKRAKHREAECQHVDTPAGASLIGDEREGTSLLGHVRLITMT